MFARIKSLFANIPRSQVRHPELGVILRYSDAWIGTAQRQGRKLRFTVAGTGRGPDAALLAHLVTLLAQLDELERIGSDFLRSQESIGRAQMEIYSLEFPCPSSPGDFCVVFSAKGDDSRQWHVRFRASQPVNTTPFEY